jgi:hypothetical protein
LFGDVPPLPPNVGTLFALIAWITTCGSYFIFVHRRDARWRLAAIAGSVGTAALALVTLMSSERARGSDRSLVTESLAVHELPALSSSTVAQAVLGEQVRIVAHEGGWDRVSFRDGRDGWVEGRLLQSLEVPAAR